LRFQPLLFSAPCLHGPRQSIIASPTFIRRFTTWSPPPLVVAVRRLVARLAVAIARDLALVHHQIDRDNMWASEAQDPVQLV
jgi:hypothetical protein